MIGEGGAESPQNAVIGKLYEGIKPDEHTVTARGADAYKRIFGFEKVPLNPKARVLDVGSGNATIKGTDFGLQEGNLVRVDMSPQNPDVQEGNILQLPVQNEQFDETWAMFVLKYVDHRLPLDVSSRLHTAAEVSQSPLGAYTLADNYATFQGLKAVSELLRVTKPGGRVRIGSYLYDFKQGGTLKSILTGMMAEKIQGLTVNGTEVPSSNPDPEEKEANIFLEKGEGYDQAKFDGYVEEEFQRLVPAELVQAITQPNQPSK